MCSKSQPGFQGGVLQGLQAGPRVGTAPREHLLWQLRAGLVVHSSRMWTLTPLPDCDLSAAAHALFTLTFPGSMVLWVRLCRNCLQEFPSSMVQHQQGQNEVQYSATKYGFSSYFSLLLNVTLPWLTFSFGKDPDAGKDCRPKETRVAEGWWLDSITNSIDMNLTKFQKIMKDREASHAAVHGSQRVSWTRLSDWTTTATSEKA